MKDLFLLLKQKNLSPNGYYILYCMDNNCDLDLPVSHGTEEFKLKVEGFLDENSKLTEKAREVLIQAERQQIKQLKNVSKELDDSFKENVLKYKDLFPKGIVAGKALRVGSKELETRLTWFFKSYPQFTWDTIFKATEKYIDAQSSDMRYCMRSDYFIKKDDKSKSSVSLLAAWCEQINESDDDDTNNPIDDFYQVI